jgi:hypothetical protein
LKIGWNSERYFRRQCEFPYRSPTLAYVDRKILAGGFLASTLWPGFLCLAVTQPWPLMRQAVWPVGGIVGAQARESTAICHERPHRLFRSLAN